ncbi:MAG: SulP family inorganic anion transporter, partial [Burkholderiales bacterium]|nr:SulP family inorganic anion transporter [Burkholderiales bacterium]
MSCATDRSCAPISSPASTGFSSVVTSAIVVVTLLWLTPLLYHLPQATLAAVIMMAVVGLINIKAIQHAWKAHRQDGVVAVVTFVLTLAFAPHLDKGILIGAGLALILYLYRTMQPRVAVLARHADGTLRDAEVFSLKTCDEIAVVRFDGSLYFAREMMHCTISVGADLVSDVGRVIGGRVTVAGNVRIAELGSE